MRRILTLVVGALMLLAASGSPARGFYNFSDIFDSIPCVADNNNYHISPTYIDFFWVENNAVSEDDQFDWFCFPGTGDVDWECSLTVLTNSPGLVVRAYFDDGSGLTQIFEGSPAFESEDKPYKLLIKLEDTCADAGFAPPLSGDFFFRITYYSAYPGIHPYQLSLIAFPRPSTPGVANSSLTPMSLPVSGLYHGTLTQLDYYDFFSWEHPAGQPVDGVIELARLSSAPEGEIPAMRLVLFAQGGAELASMELGAEGLYADIDLEPLALQPAKFIILVTLTESTNYPVTYQLRNRSIYGTADGYAADNNQSISDAVILSADSPFAGSICRPRDENDFYTYQSPCYFIGDILMLPWSLSGMFNVDVYCNDKRMKTSRRLNHGLSFYRDPIAPGTLDIKVFDFTPASKITPYQIKVMPDGAGPYQAPGHDTWEDAQPIMDENKFWFELEPTQQDRYCFSASTPAEDVYLVGFMEIYGSRADYEIRVGILDPQGPAWGPVMAPDPDGRIVLDFGYEILADPGNYILRIKLGDNVTGRRRFNVNQALGLAACYPEGLDTMEYPRAAFLCCSGYDYYLLDVLCPPVDVVDYSLISIREGAVQDAVPPSYTMTVRAGYPGMRFKLWDFSQVAIWQTQINELGGKETVNLYNLVQDGRDYVLEVSISATEERLMLWRAEFNPPPLRFIDPGVFLKMKVPAFRPSYFDFLDEDIKKIL